MLKDRQRYRRGRPSSMLILTLIALLVASLPLSLPAANRYLHTKKVNAISYKQTHGYWEVVELPAEFRLNAIHAAILPTGKVLLVAGSGNNRENFESFHNNGQIQVLKTAILNPENMDVKMVATPSDLFCSGHAFLQNGNLLVAGGTSGYEVLKNEVTRPGGQMVIHNENPDDKQRIFKKGTKFTNKAGDVFLSTQDAVIEPATKIDHGSGSVMIHHSSAKIFVESSATGDGTVTTENERYDIEGLAGQDAQNIYGQGGPMTMDKQDYRGDNKAYEFDPVKEEYVRVGDLKESRWYPSLPVLASGQVLAVSGLDNAGIITETTEQYDPSIKQWAFGPNRAFPTYPALFRTRQSETLFFSGSNAGYGPQDKGREPGFWNVRDNSFTPVPGLRDSDKVETSGSVMLPPSQGSNDDSQSERIMIAGGGGIGESELVTARTDVIDLKEANPQYKPGPDLPVAVRYLNMTVMPSDEIFAAGGTSDYRAKDNSYSRKSFTINPTTNQISPLADEPIDRGYHSGTILLPDGRILAFGNDPLYSDKDNTKAGKFEQRLEIFTPPQIFRGERPVLKSGSSLDAKRGETLLFDTNDADRIKTARLIPPSSSTHVTNLEQRSVGAIVKGSGDKVSITLPADQHLLPNGWYMLFVNDDQGTPSRAIMLRIIG